MEAVERKYTKTYEIVGRSQGDTFVCTPFCSKLRIAVDYFVKKYPRFKGAARIRTQLAQEIDTGLLITDSSAWVIIDSFESTKELKEYLMGLSPLDHV